MARLPDFIKMKKIDNNNYTIIVDDFPDYGNMIVTIKTFYSRKLLIKMWIVKKLLFIAGWLMNSQVEFDIIIE